jgi:putative tricarboxylic transport membrane protein
VGTLLIAAFAPPLAELAFKFGPAEYFSLMVLGLIAAVVLASGSLVKALAMILLGLLLGMIGTDVISGAALQLRHPGADRRHRLRRGRDGLFGFAEIIANLGPAGRAPRGLHQGRDRPVAHHGRTSRMPPAGAARHGLGSLLGMLPGGGAVLSSFAAYTLEKKISEDPVPFGKGAIEGVAGPEAANNAGAQTSFIPMLTLGIPPNAVMALMVGAMTIKGIQPGPQVMTSNPSLFWGLIASMWIGNLMLVILNLPLIGIWIKLLTVPYRCCSRPSCCSAASAYSLNNNVFDVFMTARSPSGLRVLQAGLRAGAAAAGLHPRPLMEENLRRALLLSRGDWSVFVTRPLSAREEAFQDEG